ncbi:transporter [Seongchinamella unica]|uniref:Transporter n=1 Tax=Seongchinamella unica TaxID=2547392 RepID=A0A4R5LTJ3_9GAMM|nr:transporter [Seongchinamella unica]
MSLPATAQELEPRSFNNVPVSQTFVSVGLVRSEGELAPPGSSPLEKAELTIDVLAAAVSRSFSLAGDSAKADMVVARSCYEGWGIFQGEYVEGRRCEYLDPKFKLTWNFYGAPATELKDFARWQEGMVIGASVAVTAPWGTYNSEHLINAGSNRWQVKPVIGMSRRRGNWQWELHLGATFYEDNDNFFNGIHVEQDPLYSTSVHLIYNFSRGWLSLDGNYFTGGRTTKNGVRQDDRQDNSRWGITWTRPLGGKHLIKLNANTGVITRIGNDFDTFGIGWVYRL